MAPRPDPASHELIRWMNCLAEEVLLEEGRPFVEQDFGELLALYSMRLQEHGWVVCLNEAYAIAVLGRLPPNSEEDWEVLGRQGRRLLEMKGGCFCESAALEPESLVEVLTSSQAAAWPSLRRRRPVIPSRDIGVKALPPPWSRIDEDEEVVRGWDAVVQILERTSRRKTVDKRTASGWCKDLRRVGKGVAFRSKDVEKVGREHLSSL